MNDQINDSNTSEISGEPPTKKLKLSGAQKKKLARLKNTDDARNAKGMNTNRRFLHVNDKVDICWRFSNGETCPNGSRYFCDLLVANAPTDCISAAVSRTT